MKTDLMNLMKLNETFDQHGHLIELALVLLLCLLACLRPIRLRKIISNVFGLRIFM